jgi:hypothetical protein
VSGGAPFPADDPYARLGEVLDAVRRDVAAGRPLDLAARLAELDAEVAALAAAMGHSPGLQSAAARSRAVLQRLAALARVRERLDHPQSFGPPGAAAPGAAPDTAAPDPVPAPAARPSLRDALLTAKVTISGNLLVEKRVETAADGATLRLSWKLPPAAQDVVVQVEERPDPRGDYGVIATESLGVATSWTVQIGETPTRLVVRVDGRGGRVLGRARISGLTAANAASKWQRQATAA